MSGILAVEVLAGSDFDLAKFYRDEGFAVVELEVGDKPPLGPFVLANCVGLTKTLLGVRKLLIVTPYTLYRYLRRAR
jgi:hypothetical protein